MIRMDEAGYVRRGIVTGWTNFFVLRRKDVDENRIGKRYVRPRVAGGDNPVLVDANAESYLLDVRDGKGALAGRRDGRGVLGYIRSGEKMEARTKVAGVERTVPLPELPTLSARRLWYSLGIGGKAPPIFLSRIINDRIKVYENRGSYRATNTFVSYTPSAPGRAGAFMAYFASSWFALYLEANANPMGGGALSVEVRNFNAAPVPDFDSMPATSVTRLGRAWGSYCETLDSGKLDSVVLGILGFSDTEQAAIRAELAALAGRRMGRRLGGRRPQPASN